MEFLELAKKRYSSRAYETRKVEEEKLIKILEAGRVAPTAANLQPQTILVIEDESTLKKLKENSLNHYNAPLVIVVCANKDEAWKNPYTGKLTSDIDTTIVCDHMMLEATDLGLQSVWICYFDEPKIHQFLKLPNNYEVINILAIGYGKDEKKESNRHSKTRKLQSENIIYYKDENSTK